MQTGDIFCYEIIRIRPKIIRNQNSTCRKGIQQLITRTPSRPFKKPHRAVVGVQSVDETQIVSLETCCCIVGVDAEEDLKNITAVESS